MRTSRPLLVAVLFLSMSCGDLFGCRRNPGGPNDGGPDTAGTATLREGVRVVDASDPALIVSRTESEWIVTPALAAAAGQVLLTDAEAVVVDAVNADATVLTVRAAHLEEVFSQVDLETTVDIDGAEFTSADEEGQGSRGVRGSALVTTIDGTLPISLPPPFAGTVRASANGNLSFAYDDAVGAFGSLGVRLAVDGAVQVSGASISAPLPEYLVGTIRIPIPLSVVDAALQVVGIRIASIYIPIRLGADLTGALAPMQLSGSANVQLGASYHPSSGLVVTDPVFDGAMDFNASPGGVPGAQASASVTAGVYVKAQPQLLILNSVASIGVEGKCGLYATGTLSLVTSPSPYYCLSTQGSVKGETLAFFRGIGGTSIASATLPFAANVGPVVEHGVCDTDFFVSGGSVRLRGAWRVEYAGQGTGDGDDFWTFVVRPSDTERLWMEDPYTRDVQETGAWFLEFRQDNDDCADPLVTCPFAYVTATQNGPGAYTLAIDNDQSGDTVLVELTQL